MKISNIPFHLTLASSLTPIIGSLLGLSLFHLPFFLLIFFILILLITKGYSFTIKIDFLFFVFVTMIVSLSINLILLRGFTILAMGGYVIFFAFLFQNFFFNNRQVDLKNFLNFLNFFYKSFLIILLIELVLIIGGFQPLLGKFLDGIPSYKLHNSFDVGRFISSYFDKISGLNSIFLGSQIAGTMCLISFVWFHSMKKLNYFYNFNQFRFWKYLALFLFIVSITGTNFFVMLILIVISSYKYFKRLSSKIFNTLLILILIGGVYYLIENQIIYSRIYNLNPLRLPISHLEIYERTGTLQEVLNLNRFEYYIWSFFKPVQLWFEQNLINQLFGTSDSIDGTKVFVGGDFAYGSILLFGGILFTISYTLIIFRFIYYFLINEMLNNFHVKILQYVVSVIVVLFFSLVHWGQAITNPGIITFFALHIAIANIMVKNKFKLIRD
jgi:hypothetical protein